VNRLDQAVGRAQRRAEYKFAVLFLDVDRFKNINDSLGHSAGDLMIKEMARRIAHCLRLGDTPARIGGDEFTVLLDDIADASDATRVAERFQQELSQPFALDGHEVVPSVSVGIALSTTGYERAEDVLRDADIAVARAKVLGTGRREIFDTAMHERALRLLRLESDLRRALERQAFEVYYQAIVSLKTGRLSGFEALARWQHPARGMISPGEFIPIAEDTGLIIPMDQWVLGEACRQMNEWQERLGADLPLFISVNLSSKQFSSSDLVEQVQRAFQSSNYEPRKLKLEITESAIMDNSESASHMLARLRELGIQLSIDDFGTGYSSLSYLHRFPLDTLKVDRSFVSRMDDQGEVEIVRAIITLAQNLAMNVIAEGVETPEQLALLRELKCDYGQGYFFSRPLTAIDAWELIQRNPEW
jgi:diguanylate cyclase (GGDEF)-like protein